MPSKKTEIAIVGTGAVGLITALTLATTCPFKITLFGRKLGGPNLTKDTRTTAFMPPSLNLFENIGILDRLLKNAAPLKGLRLIDDSGSLFRTPDCCFMADELGLRSFASNIPNSDLLSVLTEKIEASDQINWIANQDVSAISTTEDWVHLEYGDNCTIEAKLCIGADGRNSICRKSAGINSKQWSYEQSAIACGMEHKNRHNGISTELHRGTGPLTLIPLKEHHSSLVWSLKPEQANDMALKSDEEFISALTKASHNILGEITTVGKRVAFPISCLTVEKFAANRIALVGESAHALSPIGAQGLNLGVRDCAHLADCIKSQAQETRDPGHRAVITSYNQSRKIDVQSRTQATDILNKSLILPFLPYKIMRYAGLHLIKHLKPLREIIMQEGMGASKSGATLLNKISELEATN